MLAASLRCGAVLSLALLSSACEPELRVGTWACPSPAEETSDGSSRVVDAPWSTGFERGFCDYEFCYADPDASFTLVEAPVHSGRRAAAFSVTADPAQNGRQTRCFREGALPREATYGAWFHLPRSATNTGNWNLVHLQGRQPGEWRGLWDVSLGSAEDGSLFLYLFDFLGVGIRRPVAAPPVPIGSWFHVELRLRRASDATGEVELRQNGVSLLEITGIVTDDTDIGQWYVGNLADGLTPADSTLYVDDVTVRTE